MTVKDSVLYTKCCYQLCVCVCVSAFVCVFDETDIDDDVMMMIYFEVNTI